MLMEAHDTDSVRELCARLRDPARRRPLAVVTTLEHSPDPLVDVTELLRAVGDVADAALVPTGPLTYVLQELLPEHLATFNGAVRSFPPGVEWLERPSLARRRFSFHTGDAARVLDGVIDDLLGMAQRAGLTVTSAVSTVEAEGVVHSILAGGERAMVALDGGGIATVSGETFAPAPLGWVITEGMRVRGHLDSRSRRLEPAREIAEADALWGRFPECSVTLALVHRVERQRAVLMVHPEHPVTVMRPDLSTNTHDRVDLLLTEGDVIEVRVTRDAQGRRALRTVDLDDDEPVLDAVPLMVGGPPWLRAGRTLVEAHDEIESASIDSLLSAPADSRAVEAADAALTGSTAPTSAANAPAVPRPGPGVVHVTELAPASSTMLEPAPGAAADPAASLSAGGRRTALQSALATIEQLRGELRVERERRDTATVEALQRELAATRAALASVRADQARWQRRAADELERVKATQASLRDARRRPSEPASQSPRDRRPWFDDADSWVRHELYLQWVERLAPASRAEHPLPSPVLLGPEFAASLEQLDDRQLPKALRCAMEAVTHVIRSVSSRQVHPLRSGDGGDDKPVVRDDGARCLRAYVEQNTPQARRLHYWVLPGGEVKLSRVVAHDDVQP